ncbi:MAG: hypothetical protein WC718_01185 [Phycisphaerales bacterium]|jgi:predicted amidophosphoribosyltransferase
MAVFREPLHKPTPVAWPPRPLPGDGVDRRGVDWTAPKRLGGAAARGASLDVSPVQPSWWGQVERAWLGLTKPPLAERAALCGWRADAPGEACVRCASSVGVFEADEGGCPACRERRLPWARFVRLGEYDGLLQRVVCETKFTAWRRLGRDIGRLLGAQLADALERAGVEASRAMIVPVPTTFWRRMQRGIDHTWCIARGVRDVTGVEIVRGLTRANVASQASLPKTRRMANVRGTMRARGVDFSGRTVIVLDDVRTTGATMLEACRALQRGEKTRRPREVWGAVAAVTPDDRRRRELRWRDETDASDDGASDADVG